MKYLTIPLLFFSLAGTAQSEEIEIKSSVKEVTLFLSGAQESRTAKVNIPAGSSILKFTGLPGNVDPNSIQVRGVSEFTILSLNYRQNHLSQENDDPEINRLKDSLEKIQFRSEILQAEKSSLNEEKNMMQSNRRLVNNNGLVIDDMKEISDYTTERIRLIDLRLYQIRKEEEKNATAQQRITAQIQQVVEGRQRATGEILVNVSSKNKINTSVQLNYLTTGAGWRPYYDVRAKEVGGPVELAYKAWVYQSTGTDWENVKLTLSTASPNTNNSKPYVPVWVLDFVPDYPQFNNGYYKGNAVPLSNTGFELESKKKQEGKTYAWGQSTTIAQNALNTEFRIQSPYSIPSDGIEYAVEIGTYEFPAAYRYSAVPKLAEDAFLMALVTGWNEYSLLSAESNIYYQGTYVGKSFLNTNTTHDTLQLSMGSDESVVIKRKNVSDLTSKSVSGNTKKQQEDFEITIRNTKSVPITIEIEDQVPVSKQKEISVEVLETGNAEYDKESGKLLWKIKLEPGSSTTLKFSYLVKYPKNFVISNL